MKVKRQKCKRKSLRFYTTCFGFREPFKILCDGTFIHHVVSKEAAAGGGAGAAVKDAEVVNEALSYLLRSETKVFTTMCCVEELKRLGSAFTKSYEAAMNLGAARCGHEEKKKSAFACIEDVIGMKNTEHFFVATQDIVLRRKFNELPGVPVIYGQPKFLFLDPPSSAQRQFAKATEEERIHIGDLERKMLQNVRHSTVLTQKTKASSVDGQENLSGEAAVPQALSNSVTTLKRKKAKGPNPLSCKKKKQKTNDGKQARVPNQGAQDGKDATTKRKRKRKSSSKSATNTIS